MPCANKIDCVFYRTRNDFLIIHNDIHETNNELTNARMHLVEAAALVIKLGLNLLSVSPLEEM